MAPFSSDPSSSAATSSLAVDLTPIDPPSTDSDLSIPAAPTPGTGLLPKGSPVCATQSPAIQPVPATASSSTPKYSTIVDSNVDSMLVLPNKLVDLAQWYLVAAKCYDASDDCFMDFVYICRELFFLFGFVCCARHSPATC
ncbi:uncharacterized protein DNG_10445 [Cephalotrichum gorgonifer]|uniref:Uncharacterized protein n=1 Tax=Cephalotrichum gorgonifer TaxID=2041049 RepID=A0AAE8N9I3_9PEZI|nr:uncharacterized protein DNG_10445 [Cephalotrichum gorgonifer]